MGTVTAARFSYPAEENYKGGVAYVYNRSTGEGVIKAVNADGSIGPTQAIAATLNNQIQITVENADQTQTVGTCVLLGQGVGRRLLPVSPKRTKGRPKAAPVSRTAQRAGLRRALDRRREHDRHARTEEQVVQEAVVVVARQLVRADEEVRVVVRARRVVGERVVTHRHVEREEVAEEDVDAATEVEADALTVVERRVVVRVVVRRQHFAARTTRARLARRRVAADLRAVALELRERDAGLEVEVEGDVRLLERGELAVPGRQADVARAVERHRVEVLRELVLRWLARRVVRLALERRHDAVDELGVDVLRRDDADATDREHVTEVVLELETAADDVLELGVDRRLEQRRRFEAALDEQPAMPNRDVARARPLLGGGPRRAASDEARSRRRGARAARMCFFIMVGSWLSGTSCTRTSSAARS